MIVTISVISIILGTFIGWWMPDSPTRAKCFSEEDKLLIVERVRANDQGLKNTKWIPEQVWEALMDPLIPMLFMAMVFSEFRSRGLYPSAAVNGFPRPFELACGQAIILASLGR